MKATPTIEFTFESPCPGQLENVVALDVEGDAAPRAASTRAHVAGCPRCRAFKESLKKQASYVKRWFKENPVPGGGEWSSARRNAVREDLGLTPWLNDALKVRSERALAIDLWRCAAAVYRMDPAVDGKTTFEDAVVRKTPRTAIRLAVESMLRGSVWNSSRSERNASKADAESVTARALALVRAVEEAGRLPTAIRLLALSDAIVERPIASSLLLQSEIDWHEGPAKKTVTLLESAYRASTRPIDRLHAMNNLAVWSFDRNSFEEAQALARRAIETTSDSVLARMNLAIWSFAFGNHAMGDSLVSSALRACDAGALSWSIDIGRSMIGPIEIVLGRPPGSLAYIVDKICMRANDSHRLGTRMHDESRMQS